ncbi:inhibitor of nuclear factor kappa-B kinase subunit alpha [Euwallacea fornicatus]|uniref:inhibitor of nuclear factor kappa-B kinase subunit alpha n=1 Tax=Euwallacea fornicatus TaxID=995702 RepID=UPI00338DE15F
MEQPTLIGEWMQISILGSGSFGTVSLWRHQRTSESVAIKKCKYMKPSALSAKQTQRWHMEVEFLKSVDHPNIIKYKSLDPILDNIINKYNPTNLPLLSMEYCTKGNLRRYLTNEPVKLCGLPESDVRMIIRDISEGLSYLHKKNITHRDVKPDNIVLQDSPTRKGSTVYKLIDLGYAKELQDSTLSFVGTLHYLAPEIFYNQDYDYRVDYWSMGTMVFEIICGVLPFLPEFTPFHKYEKIKNKDLNDICIFLNNSGSVSNSTEIKKENFVTSCFKQNMEIWLRKVLQMDPGNRKFSNNLSAFDYLKYILDKKIIQVFSVFKLEFYSYEVNDSTQFGTLKDWISRDIKIPKSDLHFLFRYQTVPNQSNDKSYEIIHCNDDRTLLQYLICHETVILYVYKEDSMLHDKCFSPKLPNLLKDIFNNSNFPLKYLKRVYRLALFYIYSSCRAKETFECAYLSLIQHIQSQCEKVKNQYIKATSEFRQLLEDVHIFNQKLKEDKLNGNIQGHLNNIPEFGECLKYGTRIISNLERRQANLNLFGKQYKMLEAKKLSISEIGKYAAEVFAKCNILSQFEICNNKGFLQLPKNGDSSDIVLKPIRDVISETLKLECNLYLKETKLKDSSRDFCVISKFSEDLLFWVDDFVDNIQKLSIEFGVVRASYDKIVSEAMKTKKLDFVLNLNTKETEELIKENEVLRCRFIDLLSQRMAAHKDFVEAAQDYLDLN